MTWASIGGQDCTSVQGDVTEPAHTLRELVRFGRHGHSYQRVGKRAPVCSLWVQVDVDNAALAAAMVETFQAMQGGDPVTIVDAHGLTWPSVEILHVRLVRIQQLAVAVGGLTAGLYLVTLELTVQSTYLS